MADNNDDNIEIFNISLSQDLVTALKNSDVPLTNNGTTLSPQAKKFIATYKKTGTKKAYGGKIKKKMMGGKIKKTYAMGGGIRKANYK